MGAHPNDGRNATEKLAWRLIGPPLYYCKECLVGVDVTVREGQEPIIKRHCLHTGEIIAPRRSILAGEGGLNFVNKIKMTAYQWKSMLTGRT